MDVKVLRCVSSTAQSAVVAVALLLAMQNSALSPTQKTSRQHAVTPKSGGSCLNDVE